jgi:RNA polymerase sigma-70 factor (ECF subfamily)
MPEKSLQQLALDFVDSRTEKSFTFLYNRLKPGLKKFIQKYHQDSDTVDEILAITLSKAYVYVDKYDSRWNFSTWIYKICQNECLMEIRRKNAISSYDNIMDSKMTINAVNDEDWKFTPEYEVFQEEEVIHADSLYSEVLEEISNLPEHYREIIEDRVVDKMKYKDIADKRGLKINTVRSRIHSAKKVIKNLWIEKKRKTNSKTINILGVTILQLLGEDEKSSSKNFHGESSISISKAKYGAGNAWFDVTEKVTKIFEEKREVKSSNRLAGDPCYGSAKALVVEYSCEGKKFNVEIREGKVFSA